MISALVINSGTHGSENYFVSTEQIKYTHYYVTKHFDPDLSAYNLLIAGNAVDHIAMFKIKDKIEAFLAQGNCLFCFSGWYTNYIPDNRWIMNTDIKSIDVRYQLGQDRYGIFNGVNIDELIYTNNISGWWACGYIEASAQAEILLTDSLNRPVMILDKKSTKGTIICTAGGPLNDKPRGENESLHAINVLYNNLIDFVAKQKMLTKIETT